MSVQCRSCLSTTAAEYVDMETSRVGQYSFLEFFHALLQLHTDNTDELEQLPKTMCNGCSHDLQVAYDFIEGSRQADSVLRQNIRCIAETISTVGALDSTEMEPLELSDQCDDVEECVVEELLEGDDDAVSNMEIMEVETIEGHMVEETLEEDGELEYVDVKPQLDELQIEVEQHLKSAENYADESSDEVYLKEFNAQDQVHKESVATLAGGTSKWKCIECKRVLRGDVSYEGHMNWHRNKRPYKCTECECTFRCKDMLARHSEQRHEMKTSTKRFVCELCRKVFRSKNLLEEHKQHDHKVQPGNNCGICGKTFDFPLGLKEHLHLMHSKADTVKCPYCRLQPDLPRDEMAEHFRIEHPAEYGKHFEKDPAKQPEGTVCHCDICDAVFSTDAALRAHRSVHVNSRPNVCQYCEKRFASPATLRSHIRTYHADEPTVSEDGAEEGDILERCKLCKKQLLAKNLEKHMSMHERKERAAAEEQTKFLCAYCPRECKNRKSLNQHEKMHDGESMDVVYVCADCNRQYATEHLLLHHRKQAHKERDHICPICGNMFKLKNQLVNHMKLHLEKNIQCPHCDKKYARQFDLNVHMRSHTGEQPYACHLCDRRFAIKVRLTYHLQKHYGVKHPCKECGAQFNSRQKLKAHSFKHTGMPYRCEMCDNHGFANRDVFKRHMLRVHNMTMADEALVEMFQRNTAKEFGNAMSLNAHELNMHTLRAHGEQKHKCPLCDRRFTLLRNRNIHLKHVHAETRTHACGVCGNAFKDHAQLTAHKLLHKEKQFACTHCHKKYPRRADLKVHLRTHTGELPYACHLCEQRFAIKVRLTYHLQKHDGVQHPCPHCDAVYDNRNKLRDHMFKHTGMPYRCEECPGVGFSRRRRFATHMLCKHKRQLTEEELAAIFAKNTGKTVLFKPLPYEANTPTTTTTTPLNQTEGAEGDEDTLEFIDFRDTN